MPGIYALVQIERYGMRSLRFGLVSLALPSTLAASRTEGLLADGASEAVALTGGCRLAFTLSLALLVAAFVTAYVVLRRPRAGAERAAELQRERA
ncbi:MAG: hypothetical protein IRY84_18480 [Thermobispora bispora]|nr:hypothetical protein [Thermobispora bispora]